MPFTPTKDYSPKRQFFKILFHYGVKLTTCKTVSVETPTQNSIYDIYCSSLRTKKRAKIRYCDLSHTSCGSVVEYPTSERKVMGSIPI